MRGAWELCMEVYASMNGMISKGLVRLRGDMGSDATVDIQVFRLWDERVGED